MQAVVVLGSLHQEDPAEDAAVALPAPLHELTPEYTGTTLPTTDRTAATSSAEDEQLIREWQAGVKTAGTRFYYLYKDRIYRWALVKTRDPHQAEDLCQEVWRRIHRSLQTYREGTSPKSWVYRILINTHRSLWRRGKRFFAGLLPSLQDNHELDNLPEVATSRGGTPEALLTHKQELELAINAMHKIPEPFRRVVFLRYGEGLPIEDVANILGISEGTVKSRLNRGMEKLRELLGANEKSRPGVKR